MKVILKSHFILNLTKIIIPFFLMTSCKTTGVEIIELQISKSSIPEGIAVHSKTKEIYISSIHKNKITKSTSNGKKTETILDNTDNGYTKGVGLDIWQDEIYALSNFKNESYSILTIKNLQQGQISTIKANDIKVTSFNDLAIDVNGDAYITDTHNHNIYKFVKSNQEISLYLTNDEIKYPNGIAISDDQSKLFIDSYTSGIRIVDIKTKKIINKPHPSTTKIGIDGLKYHNGYLYMIVNGSIDKENHGLYKANLRSSETMIGEIEPVLIHHNKMNIPTTISIRNNTVYILANSQLENLNQTKNQIIDKNKLTNTYIIKMKIKSLN